MTFLSFVSHINHMFIFLQSNFSAKQETFNMHGTGRYGGTWSEWWMQLTHGQVSTFGVVRGEVSANASFVTHDDGLMTAVHFSALDTV